MHRAWCAKVVYPNKQPFLYGTLIRPLEDKEETVRNYMYKALNDTFPEGFIIQAMLPGYTLILQPTEDF